MRDYFDETPAEFGEPPMRARSSGGVAEVTLAAGTRAEIDPMGIVHAVPSLPAPEGPREVWTPATYIGTAGLENHIAGVMAHWLLEEGSYLRSTSLGFDATEWPRSPGLEALRSMAEAFAEHLVGRSYNAARVELRRALEGWALGKNRLAVIEDPQPLDDLMELYVRDVRATRLQELAQRIRTDGANAEAHVVDFLQNRPGRARVLSLDRELDKFLSLHRARQAEGKSVVVIDGWPTLSNLIGGFNGGRLSMLVAKTGFGKTNIALNFCRDAARSMPATYFNMEMTYMDFLERLAISASNTSYEEVRSTGFQEFEVKNALQLHSFRFTSGADMSLGQLIAEIFAEHARYRTKFFVVDYDQKIILDERSGEPEWKLLQRSAVALEGVAKRLDVHIMLCAQSNDEGGIAGSKRSAYPAYTVLNAFHDEDEDVDLIQAVKNRGGPGGAAVRIEYQPSKARVAELERYWLNKKKKRGVPR